MWILLNWTVQKRDGRIWIGFIWLRIEITTSTRTSSSNSFENGRKSYVIPQKESIFQILTNSQLHKCFSAPRNK